MKKRGETKVDRYEQRLKDSFSFKVKSIMHTYKNRSRIIIKTFLHYYNEISQFEVHLLKFH